MGSKQLFTVIVLGTLLGASSVMAEKEQGGQGMMMSQGSMMAQKGAMASDKADGNVVEVGNQVCPVSKQPVDGMGEPLKVEYKGKVYNLCCKMCKMSFLKDPEKYSAIADAEVAADKK